MTDAREHKMIFHLQNNIIIEESLARPGTQDNGMKTIILTISFLLLPATACFGDEDICKEIRGTIAKYNSFRKIGTVTLVCGLIGGTVAGVMLATNKQPNPPMAYDRNYKIKQMIAGRVLRISISTVGIGSIMTLFGIYKVNKYKKLSDKFRCDEESLIINEKPTAKN
jgi:hypothetical protein